MSEEDVIEEEAKEEPQRELSEAEQTALEYGWKHPNDWVDNGDGSKPMDAEAFLSRPAIKAAMRTNEAVTAQNKELSAKIEAMQAQFIDLLAGQASKVDRIDGALKEQESATVLEQFNQAVEDGDADLAAKLALKLNAEPEPEPEPEPTIPPEVTDFLKANPWAGEDTPEAEEFQDFYALQRQRGKSPAESLKIAQNRVRPTKPQRPARTDSPTLGTSRNRQKGFSDMTQDEQDQTRQMIRLGAFVKEAKEANTSPEEYAAKKYWERKANG